MVSQVDAIYASFPGSAPSRRPFTYNFKVRSMQTMRLRLPRSMQSMRRSLVRLRAVDTLFTICEMINIQHIIYGDPGRCNLCVVPWFGSELKVLKTHRGGNNGFTFVVYPGLGGERPLVYCSHNQSRPLRGGIFCDPYQTYSQIARCTPR